MGDDYEKASSRQNAQIIVYWGRYSEDADGERNQAQPADPLETQVRALTEEVDSAKNFHPDQRQSLEALGRFIEKNRNHVRFTEPAD